MNSKSATILAVQVILGQVVAFQKVTKEIIHKTIWPEVNHPGYVQIGSNPENEMFYWLFPSRRSPSNDPQILWLTGGPGCSAEIALFMENGPFRIDRETLEVGTNIYSWNTHANVVYIDQPLGTGLSSVDPKNLIKNEQEVSEEVYEFLTKFYELYPSFKGRDFYVFGESYAGHYVPNISNYIYHQDNANLRLKGVGIGNGLTNPWVQYSAYAEFSLQNKLIDWDTYMKMLPAFRRCETMMQYGIKGGKEECDALYGQILTGGDPAGGPGVSGGGGSANSKFNCYDITKPCYGSVCYNWTFLDQFMALKSVKADLGVPSTKTWEKCNVAVGNAMARNDQAQNPSTQLIDLVNGGLKVLMYNGDLDFVCNWIGGERVANALEWIGQAEFQNVKYQNIGYGTKRELSNFAYIKISNSGHMVPMDQPESALRMLHWFMEEWEPKPLQ